MVNSLNIPAEESLELNLLYVNKRHQIDLHESDIPMDDEATWKLFRKGNTKGIFQFAAPGMKEFLKALQPGSLADLETLFLLYCPTYAELISVFIQYKRLGLPFTFDIDAISAKRRSFAANHTIIAWKMAYLKANYGGYLNFNTA